MGELNLDVKGKRELGDFLYASARRGDWDEVVEEYKKASNVAQRLTLLKDKNTALHLAVIDNQEEIVERLVKLICRSKDNDDYKKLLETKNKMENNPLHHAAIMGSVRMCHVIASAHDKLVNERNKADQTPLFLAALHGNKDAFYCLYYFCRNHPDQIASNCRANGDTVLHCALVNEQFDLAFQFIDLYKEAMNWVNEQGLTALHVLASKPTSFKSGSNINGWRKIVYHCIFVNQLKPRKIEVLYEELEASRRNEKKTPSHFPIIYGTCIDVFMWLKDIFLVVNTLKSQTKKTKDDEAKKDRDLEKDADQPPSTNFPRNYTTCFDFFQIVFLAIMIFLGFGSTEIKRIRKKKEKHIWSVQLVEKLLESVKPKKYGDDGMDPAFPTDDAETFPYSFEDDKVKFSPHYNKIPEDSKNPKDVIDTAMLLAAKNGVIEIVRGMYKRFPPSIRDTGKDKKNVVLLAAEYRQPDVYRFLLKKKKKIENQFREVDHKGNSALHLAATATNPGLWSISGVALQMQWEVKWYKYVKESVPLHFFAQYNNDGKTASTVFHENHKYLVIDGSEWLYNTAESCSVVATLIATVAFATAVSIPGGSDDHGGAKLEKEQAFFIFSISSLIALCFSSTSVVMFLAILTSRFKTQDFGLYLPLKLLIGLSCLYFSIVSMLISFCTGHYFLIIHRLHNAILLYTLTFLPVALIFGIAQLPLYLDLLQSILKIVPRRSAQVVLQNQLLLCPPTKNHA